MLYITNKILIMFHYRHVEYHYIFFVLLFLYCSIQFLYDSMEDLLNVMSDQKIYIPLSHTKIIMFTI